MKKTIKSVLAVLVVFSVCLSLCSCNWLDEMKSDQAFFNEDKTCINFGENTYSLLPDSYGTDYINLGFEYEYIYVTESDVPVLLMSIFGEYADVKSDQTILGIIDDTDYTTKYYCRDDIYHDVLEVVSAKSHDNYCVEIYKEYIEDEETGEITEINNGYADDGYYFNSTFTYEYVILEDEIKDVINDIISEGTPVSQSEADINWDNVGCVEIYQCDDNTLVVIPSVTLYYGYYGRPCYLGVGDASMLYYPISNEYMTQIEALYNLTVES